MTKWCGVLAGLAAVPLMCAVVWLGGLNQDEGWYLYAAQLVRQGAMPYRDFFYTQGPLMPIVYSPLTAVWSRFGLLGARILTLAIGFSAVLVFVASVRWLVPTARRAAAGTIVFLLLGCNLYHLYFVAIPKTYALASLLVAIGAYMLVRALCDPSAKARAFVLGAAGLAFALAAGTRISLGLLLVAGGFGLLLAFRRRRWDFLWFGLGGTFGLLLAYGPFCLDRAAFDGLCAAQRYHAARGGFSPTLVVGSLSRLVRWYLPAFVLLGLAVRPFAASAADGERPGADAKLVTWLLGAGFLAVFLLQLMAPCPYDDYQVPVMGLLAVVAVSQAVVRIETDRLPRLVLLATGLAFATAFGSPLLERWTTNGQDRFWTLRKERSELAQLREAAAAVERLDPGGKTLLTQDLYLAVESGRSVPEGLEMGPFSQLTDDEWRTLLSEAECPVAALSGYAFAIEPPACAERPKELQEEFRRIVRGRYRTVETVPAFGQNATTLEIMKRKVGL